MTADPTLYDRLEQLRAAATGPTQRYPQWAAEPNYRIEDGCRCLSCWESDGTWNVEPIDGPDCQEHDCYHAIHINQADAEWIAAVHNAAPDLIAAARRATDLEQRVRALAEELERAATRDLGRWLHRADGEAKASALAIFTTMQSDARRLRGLLDGGAA